MSSRAGMSTLLTRSMDAIPFHTTATPTPIARAWKRTGNGKAPAVNPSQTSIAASVVGGSGAASMRKK